MISNHRAYRNFSPVNKLVLAGAVPLRGFSTQPVVRGAYNHHPVKSHLSSLFASFPEPRLALVIEVI